MKPYAIYNRYIHNVGGYPKSEKYKDQKQQLVLCDRNKHANVKSPREYPCPLYSLTMLNECKNGPGGT